MFITKKGFFRMKKANVLKTTLLLCGLSFGGGAFATSSINQYTATGFTGDSKSIQVLNATADPVIQLNNAGTVSLSNQSTQDNLGIGLLRAIYGEYANVLCTNSGDQNCLSVDKISNQISNGNVEAGKIASIFPRQLELSQMLANALMMFSTAVLMLQTVIFMLMFVVFLGKGTGKNSSLEESYHVGVGTILRVLLSVVLVFPTTTGYSIGLIAALQSNTISTRFGDLVWAAAVKTISPKQIENKTTAAMYQHLTNFKNFQALNDTLADAAYCTVFMNNSLEGNIKTLNGQSSNSINSGATKLEQGKWLSWGNAGFVFGAKTIITDGEIRINFGPRDPAAKGDNNRVLYRTSKLSLSDSLIAEELSYFNALADSDNNVPANYCGRITLPVSADIELPTNADASDKFYYYKSVAKNAVAYAEAQAILGIYDRWVQFFSDENNFKFKGSDSTRSGILTGEAAKGQKNPIFKLANQKKETEKQYYVDLAGLLGGKSVSSQINKYNQFNFIEPSNSNLADNFKDVFGLNGKGLGVSITGSNAVKQHLFYPEKLINIFVTANDNVNKQALKNSVTAAAKELYKSYQGMKIYNINTSKENANIYEKMIMDTTQYGWISAGSWFSTLAGLGTNYDLLDVPMPMISVPEYMRNAFAKSEEVNLKIGNDNLVGIDRTVIKQFKRYYYPVGYSINNTAAIRLSNSTAGRIGSSQNSASERSNNFGINISQWLGYDPHKTSGNQYVHPLLQLQSSGNTMMQIGEGIWGFSQIMQTLQNSGFGGTDNELVEATTRQVTGNNPALLSVDSVLSQILNKSFTMANIIGYILYFGGAMLAIYLPLLPTIYWVSGVLTWAIGGFVNLIAINIMAIGITLSRGEEVIGRAQVGAFMLLENGLRPVLQPIGGIAFVIFSGLFIPLSSFLMNEAYARLATQSTMLTGGVIYVLISIGMQYWITIQCVQLINGLHQKAMSHISAQMTVDDQSERQAQHLGGIIQQGRSESRMLNSGNSAATSGLKNGGAGTSGATSALKS